MWMASSPSIPERYREDAGGVQAPPADSGHGTMMDSQARPSDDGLSLRGIGKNYGPVTVLSGLDLDLRPGEVLALLGENGAGRSTASSIIAGLVKPTVG